MNIYNYYYRSANPQVIKALTRLLEAEKMHITGLIKNSKDGDSVWENGEKLIWNAEVKGRAEQEIKDLEAMILEL